MEAVRSEDIDIVTFLLQNGADVHVKDHRKNTALIHANMESSRTDILSVLLQNQ